MEAGHYPQTPPKRTKISRSHRSPPLPDKDERLDALVGDSTVRVKINSDGSAILKSLLETEIRFKCLDFKIKTILSSKFATIHYLSIGFKGDKQSNIGNAFKRVYNETYKNYLQKMVSFYVKDIMNCVFDSFNEDLLLSKQEGLQVSIDLRKFLDEDDFS